MLKKTAAKIQHFDYFCTQNFTLMNRGKNICKVLKDVRRKVARENDIPLEIPECTFDGECRGTCPRCETEVRYLEQELRKRKSLGKAVTIAGIALSSMVAAGCSPKQSPGEPTLPQNTPVEETAVAKTDTVAKDTLPKEEPDEVQYNGGIEVVLGFVDSSEPADAGKKDSVPYTNFSFGGIDEEVRPDTAALKNTIEIIDEPSDEWDR